MSRWRVARQFEAAPGGPRAALALLGLAIVGLLLAQAVPDFINDRLHTPVAAMIAMSCLVPLGSVLLAFLRDLAQALLFAAARLLSMLLPVVPVALPGTADWVGAALLVALPVGVSYLAESASLYDVRRVAGSLPLVQERPGVTDAVDHYLNVCHRGEPGRVPAIIVAVEGGASRSAAWTLSVMRMLDARTGGAFGSHIFAITSVSGGSLGAVTFALAQARYLPASGRSPTPTDQLTFWNAPQVTNGLVQLARADLLSSSIARMFTSDVLIGVPQRGPALERAFEHHWRWDAGFGLGDAAQGGFLAMRKDHPCLPHLLLNGTDVDTGDRLLTSSIGFIKEVVGGGNDNAPLPKIERPFSGAVDVLGRIESDIYASSAVLNSARFPLISPPGRLVEAAQDRPSPSEEPPHERLVIDGGVFENYAARTAWELAQAIQSAGKSAIEPIVVLITDDVVDLPDRMTPEGRCTAAVADDLNIKVLSNERAGREQGGIRIPEVVTSVLGLYNTRGSHARGEIVVLRRLFCDADPWHLFQFELPKPDVKRGQSAPMNWVLDVDSCRFILGEARKAWFNSDQAERLRRRLQSPDGADGGDKAQEDAPRCDQP
jgi:hypothetical protein